MKPQSVIGPLLLIGLGAVLLANTLRPELPWLELCASYWPVLLILWGALRLLELLVWNWKKRPLPTHGLSGGEWAVVILICLVGSGLHAATRYRPWDRFSVLIGKRADWFGHTHEFPLPEQRRPSPQAPHIVIENLRGAVRVAGGGAAQISVSGVKRIRALEAAAAAAANEQSPLEIATNDDVIVVRTNLDRLPANHRAACDLELTIPRAAALEVRGREGDLEVRGLEGAVQLSSDSAEVRLEDIGGRVTVRLRRSSLIRAVNLRNSLEILGGRGRDLHIENVAGAVRVEGEYFGEQRFAGLAGTLSVDSPRASLRVEQVPGHLELDLGKLEGANLGGPVRFRSVRACDVELEAFSHGAEIRLDRGDVRLRPAITPLGALQVRTDAGDIELALPENAAFQLRARTARGSAENLFGPAIKHEPEGTRGALLQGGSGGGPLLAMETSRGRIVVLKDTGQPLSSSKVNRRPDKEPRQEEIGLPVQRH